LAERPTDDYIEIEDTWRAAWMASRAAAIRECIAALPKRDQIPSQSWAKAIVACNRALTALSAEEEKPREEA